MGLTFLRELPSDRRRAKVARHEAGQRLVYALLAGASGSVGWSIEYTSSGRPRVCHPSERDCFDVSISHSGPLAAAAVSSSGPIGIDVEWRRRDRDHLGLAALAFGPAERRMVEQGGPASFYRLWTWREAMSKATGQGLPMVIDGTDRLPAVPDIGYWVSPDLRWALAHVEPSPGVSLALALNSDDRLEMVRWSPQVFAWLSPGAVEPGLAYSSSLVHPEPSADAGTAGCGDQHGPGAEDRGEHDGQSPVL